MTNDPLSHMFNTTLLLSATQTWVTAGFFVTAMALSGFNSTSETIGVINDKDMREDAQRLFQMQLSEVLAMEEAMVGEMNQLMEMATRTELREILEQHRKESAGHADRLLRIFEQTGAEKVVSEINAYDGLQKANLGTVSQFRGTPMMDAVIIASARRAKHFEIACYTNLLQTAEILYGTPHEVSSALQESLREAIGMEGHLERLAQTQLDAARQPEGVDPELEPRQIPQDR